MALVGTLVSEYSCANQILSNIVKNLLTQIYKHNISKCLNLH